MKATAIIRESSLTYDVSAKGIKCLTNPAVPFSSAYYALQMLLWQVDLR